MATFDGLKGNTDLNQFKTIIDGFSSKYGSLEGIGIDVDSFKADANNVVATHVNNICADHINTQDSTPKE
jgi:hypothetical protein